MFIKIYDNFFTKKECNELIALHEKWKYLVVPFYNVFPLKIKKIISKKYSNRINKKAKEINNSIIDYIEVVLWPTGSYKNLHFDNFKSSTTLSSVCFLNDNYEGGHLYFKDKSVITPKTGRMIFFDGNYFEHGVSKITQKTRYQLTAFYKNEKN